MNSFEPPRTGGTGENGGIISLGSKDIIFTINYGVRELTVKLRGTIKASFDYISLTDSYRHISEN